MVKATEFDVADKHERAIVDYLESEGLALWRRDHVWSDGETVERQLAGVIAGEDGPELFLASAWTTHGNTLNVRVHFRTAVELACRRFLPGNGEVAARTLHMPDRYDAAVAAAGGDRTKYLARDADTASAVYILRLEPDSDSGKRIAVATADFKNGQTVASLGFEATMSEFMEWADSEFGGAPAPAHR